MKGASVESRDATTDCGGLDSAITRADTLARELEGKAASFGVRRMTSNWLAGVRHGEQTAYGGIGETPGEAVERSLAKLLRAAAIRGVGIAAALLLAVVAHAQVPTPAATRAPNECAIKALRIYGPDNVTYRECGVIGKRRRDDHWTLRDCQPLFLLIDQYARCDSQTHEMRCVKR